MRGLRWIRLVSLAVVLGLLIGVPIRCVSDYQRRTRYVMIQEYAARMQHEFEQDARFNKVDIHQFSMVGAVRVDGTVRSPSDEAVLKKRIDETVPKIQVIWKVRVEGNPPSTTTGPAPVDAG